MEVGKKEHEGLSPLTPLRDAAAGVLRSRLRAVAERLEPAARSAPDDPSPVHKLRVSTRRAASALIVFAPCIREKDAKRARRALKRLRRSAGHMRDMDVLRALAERSRRRLPPDLAPAIDAVLECAAAERERGRRRLRRAAERHPMRELMGLRRRLIANLSSPESKSPGDDGAVPMPFVEAGRDAISEALRAVRDASREDLTSLEHMHALRLAGKRLRYTMEIFAGCFGPEVRADLLPRLEEMQATFGALNDLHQLTEFVGAMLTPADEAEVAPGEVADRKPTRRAGSDATPLEALRALHARCVEQRESRRVAVAEWWDGFEAGGFFEALELALAPTREEAALRRRPAAPLPPQPASPDAPRDTGAVTKHAWRLAAIDVGTNSIRLIVAEAYGEGNYRVLDDEREVARLGRGLGISGTLAPDAMDAAVTVIDHMRRIAEGYAVDRLRVIGTAAVRDASNGADFVRLLHERTGLAMEVINAEQEAKLAWTSAAHAFDLRSFPAAVVDVGGGSTEITLSSAGIVERVYTIPLGAVRLTETFGGPDPASTERYGDMKRHVRETLREALRDVPFAPQLLVGSGGTFEALAKIAIQERSRLAGGATVRGYDMTESEVKALLRRLRDTPQRDRARIPGLSEQRAEIIVAGALVVRQCMKRLGVERMRVNDGGIRDGMLLAMIGEFFAGRAGRSGAPDRRRGASAGDEQGDARGEAQRRAVRRFAAACHYERQHCYHVAGLALQVYDQALRDGALAATCSAECGPGWRSHEARVLLEASSVLHDCGYHINYNRHHLHSYHLIMHSDMAGFSRREIAIIANVSRYHRGPAPKNKHEEFADLDAPDRDLVRALAAVLRLVDGLDRTHMQNVRAITLERASPGAHGRPTLRLALDAPADPAVDIWGSQRKSEMFREVFGVDLDYVWRRADAGDAPVPAPSARTAEGRVGAP